MRDYIKKEVERLAQDEDMQSMWRVDEGDFFVDRKYNKYEELPENMEVSVEIYARVCHGQELPFEWHERNETWKGRRRYIWIPHEDQLRIAYGGN